MATDTTTREDPLTLGEHDPDHDIWVSVGSFSTATNYHLSGDCPRLDKGNGEPKDPASQYNDLILCTWCESNVYEGGTEST